MYYRENESTLTQPYAQSQTSCCIIPPSTSIRASDLEQVNIYRFAQIGRWRRDVLEWYEIEGSINLARQPKDASCCIAICQYCEARGSYQTSEFSCDITHASDLCPMAEVLACYQLLGGMKCRR